MNLTKIQRAGILVIAFSLTVGMIGTVWSINRSFDNLANAELAGLGPVGDALRNSLFFSAGGLVMLFIGVLLLILGRRLK